MSTTTAIDFNPFPGLRPFREEEEHLFFGRESQVDAILARLQHTRFLAVMGASGSGKSSLVNSGLVPALHGGLMTDAGSAWRVVSLHPGGDPMEALAQALAKTLFNDFEDSSVPVEKIMDTTLRMSKRGLIDIFEQAQLPEHFNLLVVVDQFEELFRYGRLREADTVGEGAGEEDDITFVNLLLEVHKALASRVYVVLTMRSDFLEDCAQFAGLPEAINDGQYLVPRMTRDERRAAIMGPVAVGGAVIAPTLLTRLVNDVGDNPDQLSILQHALNRTWARWQQEQETRAERGPLTLDHYEAIGAMERALDEHAERAYAELGTERKRHICEKIFKALTYKGTDMRGVRRPTKLVTLCALVGASDADSIAEVIEVIDVFRRPSRSFLMPPMPEPLRAETVVDISHESLMRIWERLKRWVDKEAESGRMYLRLAGDALLYEAGKTGLWRDPELQLAEDWREATRPTRHWAFQYHPGYEAAMAFLEASLALREEEAKAAVALQQRELDRAKALAAAKAESARRFRIGFMIAALLGVVALVLMFIALGLSKTARDSAENARQQERIAKENEQIALSARERAVIAQDSALAAQDRAETAAVEAERLRGIAVSEHQEAERQRQIALASLSLAERQRLAAEAARDSTEDALDEVDRQRREAERQRGIADAARQQTVGLALASAAQHQQENDETELGALLARQAFLLNPDRVGEYLNEIYDALSKTLEALDTADQPSQSVTPPGNAGVRAVAVSNQGWTASGDDDGNIYLWPPNAGPAQGVHLPGGGRLERMVFSPDGAVLLTASRGQSIKLWRNINAGQPTEAVLPGYQGSAQTVAYSPNGRYLAAAGNDNTIRVWNAANMVAAPERLAGHTGPVRAMAFSPDGNTVVSTGLDGTVRLWNVDGGAERSVLTHHAGPVHAAAFSPNGRLFITGGEDTVVRVWSASGAIIAELPGHRGPIFAAAFSPDGTILATGSGDATVRLWQVDVNASTIGRNPIILTGHTSWVRSVAFNAAGTRLVSGSRDQSVRVWKVDAGELADDICRAVERGPLTEEEWQRFVGKDIPFSKQVSCSAQ